MTEYKKTLVFIRDEELGGIHDLAIFKRALEDDITLTLKATHSNYASEESNDVLSLVEQKEELRGVTKLLNSPFDILIVVEKRTVRKNGRK